MDMIDLFDRSTVLDEREDRRRDGQARRLDAL